MKLAKTLLDKNTNVCGTMRTNRGIPHYLQKEIRNVKGESLLLLLLLFIDCNWAYARWQCYRNWTYIQKKWTYIARKQNIQFTKSSTYISRKNSISHKISQYSTSAMNRIQGTINRIRDTKHRKTTKHENKEKATAGN
jgi:hypothetical protein